MKIVEKDTITNTYFWLKKSSIETDKNLPIRVKLAQYNKSTNLAFMELQYLVQAEFISLLMYVYVENRNLTLISFE